MTKKTCEVCTELISEKRLAAVPETKICRDCLEKEGDVPLTREAANDVARRFAIGGNESESWGVIKHLNGRIAFIDKTS